MVMLHFEVFDFGKVKNIDLLQISLNNKHHF